MITIKQAAIYVTLFVVCILALVWLLQHEYSAPLLYYIAGWQVGVWFARLAKYLAGD